MSETRRGNEERLLGAIFGMGAQDRLSDPLEFVAGLLGIRRGHVQDVASGMEQDGKLTSTATGYGLNPDHSLAAQVAAQEEFTVRPDVELTRGELTEWVAKQAEIDAAQRQLQAEMRARLIGQVATVAA